MKVSYQWLSEYVDLSGVSPEELADKLTLSGVAVDIVERRNKGVRQVVVGYVTHREKHPEADKLSICRVDVGTSEELQIVCGAPNVAQGQKVPVALVGAELPGGIKIKRAKLRGTESQGMICSAKELGLEDRLLPKEIQEGILVLPQSLEVGQDVIPLLGLDDAILELDLTPNRSDCLSMIGTAYEVAAILDREVKLPVTEGLPKEQGKYSIRIEAKEECLDYAARVVKGVKIGPSPQWLQNRLIGAGIRPINNIVDVTNFVMLEYGQPLHAFDASKLANQSIIVRLANEGEKFTTLDGVERNLEGGMLLITDGTKPVAIAGVMGGENSEVGADTTDILLESAYFSGQSVRRTSKQLGLRSEASMRFEKGVDPNRIIPALNRATDLILRIAGGTSDGVSRDTTALITNEKKIAISLDRINQVVGTAYSEAEVGDVFRRLGFSYQVDNGTFQVSIPTRRPDLGIEADLIEEVARIAGYDQIPATLPKGEATSGGLTQSQRLRRNIKRIMTGAGYYQAVTYSLTHVRNEQLFAPIGNVASPIPVSMPLSEERGHLRNNLLPSLLEVAQYNVNRNVEDVAIFEMGKVFLPKSLPLTEQPVEQLWLAGFVTGKLQPASWQGQSAVVNFYDVKGVLETLFETLGLSVSYIGDVIKGLHPGRGAKIQLEGETIGYVGQLHPEIQQSYDLKESYVFQINLEAVLHQPVDAIVYKQLPRFPAIRRDLALVVDEYVQSAEIMKAIQDSAGNWLEHVDIFDVYQGEHIAKGKKSMAFSLMYRNPERTLNDEEVQKAQEKVLEYLKETLGAEIRS